MHYFNQSVWAFDLAMSVPFLILWVITSLQKFPCYCLPYYVLPNDWIPEYCFISQQGKLLFVIVFVTFLQKIWYFLHIFILYMNISSCLFSIKFHHNCLTLLNITKISTITKLHPINYLFLSAVITEHPIDNGGKTIIVSKTGLMFQISQI